MVRSSNAGILRVHSLFRKGLSGGGWATAGAIILNCLAPPGAEADGSTALQLQAAFAAAPTTTGATALTTDQRALLSGAVQSRGGDGSAVNVTATGASSGRPLSAMAADLLQFVGVAGNALPADGSRPMTQAITTPGAVIPSGGLFFWNGNYGSHGWDGGGASQKNSAVYLQPYLYGPSSAGDLLHIWAGDGIQDGSTTGFSLINAYDSIGSGATGNRNVIYGSAMIEKMPGTANSYEGVSAQGQALAPMPSPTGNGWPAAVGYMAGTLETGWDYTRVNSTAPGLFLSYGREINLAYATGAQVGESIGLAMVDASDGPNTSNQTGYAGRFANIGIMVQGGNFDCAFCVSKPTGGWVQDPRSTLFGAYAQQYGGTSTPVARYGTDLRAVSFGADAFASTNFGVDGSGRVTAAGIVTGGLLAAQTAIVAGAQVDIAGTYTTWPSFTVQPPPAGGSTATVAATTLSANQIVAFGATGAGYQAGDVVSPHGLTGVPPRWTVDTVDANGGITAWHVSDDGSVAGIPENSTVYGFDGGSGSGAMAWIGWGWNASGKAYKQLSTLFAATGTGYAVGDVISIKGDTGTAATFTVTAISPQGGIMMPLRLQSGGALTGIANGTFHDVRGVGAGSNASVQVGYGVVAVTTSPGSGYLPAPLPIITASQSNYGNASITPSMSAVSTPLLLNPGGKVFLDAAGGMWVQEIDNKVVIGSGTTRLFSIDNSGNVVAKGSVSQNGTP
ncbi:hypothetical protein [Rhizosaccharibacter radicis]|uniref:Uncharacterized protein n=1 Tax=Rhizosaccharibacter radicis TaxID=2782605 RepID=A0ABT1VV37_9PROT|nr:hypothetical protein [Acetobacteraceae bacterium KSS12]